MRVGIVGLLFVLAGCSSAAPTIHTIQYPTPRPGYLVSGASTDTGCERSIETLLELDEDASASMVHRLLVEDDVFYSCTFAEFSAFNDRVVEAHRFPGNGEAYVAEKCSGTGTRHKGSLLCTTAASP